MKITPKNYAKLLYKVTEDKKDETLDKNIKSFSKLLIKQNNIKLLNKIIKEFEDYYNKKNNILSVKVLSANKLDNSEKKEISKSLNKKLNKQIEIIEKVDPKIKGGIIIKYDDTLINGSIKNRLKLLRNNIIN